MKVLHVLDHSLPIQSGYAFRSAAILESLRRLGIDVMAVTSPKHDSRETLFSNGVTYERSWRSDPGEGISAQVRCVQQTRRTLLPLIKAFKPDVIHAHSPCLNGIAALGLGVPVVYEIRSSWEDAAVSSGKTTEGSLRYRLSRWMETVAARRAGHVVVLCDGLLNEFGRRGVPSDRLTVVGNAVDPADLPTPDSAKVDRLRHRLQLEDRIVLGFFGSFFAWEGLDTLLRALPHIVTFEPKTSLVLAGGGDEEAKLRKLSIDLNVTDHVHFVGRVPHCEIPSYYSLSDYMVFPRRAIRIAEMVTPLKPLEAMHCGSVVIASNVGGHRELIQNGITGLLFEPDDPEALARTVRDAISDAARCERIRNQAARYVRQERTWDRVGRSYLEVYDRVATATNSA